MLVLVGSYTTPDPFAGRIRRIAGTIAGRRRQRRTGIHSFRMDDDGSLTPLAETGGLPDPSYLALHPLGDTVFAVSERRIGEVASFRLDPRSGSMHMLGRVPSQGSAPCHLAVHPTGRLLLVANYDSGTVSLLRIREDRTLEPPCDVVVHEGSSVHPRQQQPHPHAAAIDPTGRFAIVPDLGLDRLLVYRIDAEAGTLHAARSCDVVVAPGDGPRHLAFHPDGRSAYVVAELACTVTAFRWEHTTGSLTPTTTLSTLPPSAGGSSTAADVVVHPSGRLVYASNRGHDSIAAFKVQPRGYLVSCGFFPSGGRWPRGLAIEPRGRYLVAANRRSGDLAVFRIDLDSGAITPAYNTRVPGCACVRFPR